MSSVDAPVSTDEPHEHDEGDEGGLNVFGDSAYADADTLDEMKNKATPLGQGSAHPQP